MMWIHQGWKVQRRAEATTKIKQSRNNELDVSVAQKHTLSWLKWVLEVTIWTLWLFDTLSLTSLCVWFYFVLINKIHNKPYEILGIKLNKIMEVKHLAQYLANNYLYFYQPSFISDLMTRWHENKTNSCSITQKVIFLLQNILIKFPTIFERLHLCKIQTSSSKKPAQTL